MKTSNVAFITLIAFAIGMVAGALFQKKYYPCVELPVVTVERDTVVVMDTVRQDVPVPTVEYRIKRDTIRVKINPADGTAVPVDPDTPDTVSEADSGQEIDVALPIEAKVYQTPDYRAVVSGFRPSLDSMEVYRKTHTVRETITKVQRPTWALSLGGGVGYTTDRRIVPHIGATLGWVIWSK